MVSRKMTKIKLKGSQRRRGAERPIRGSQKSEAGSGHGPSSGGSGGHGPSTEGAAGTLALVLSHTCRSRPVTWRWALHKHTSHAHRSPRDTQGTSVQTAMFAEGQGGCAVKRLPGAARCGRQRERESPPHFLGTEPPALRPRPG